MSLIRFYGYRDKVLIPTVEQAEEGFYFDVEPVTVFNSKDEPQLRAALAEALSRGNPVVKTPERSGPLDAGSPILDKLGLKRWLRFEAEASMYTVHLHDGTIDYYSTGNAVNGSWNASNKRHSHFGNSFDIKLLIDHIISDVRKDQAQRQTSKIGGLILLPPPTDS